MPDQWTFTDPTGGTTIDLTDETAGYRITASGSRGLHSPQWNLATSKYAGLDGVTTDAIQAEAGDVALGISVRATSESELLARIRALVHTTRPKLGQGRLMCRHPDGTTRTLTCRVIAGLPGSEDPDSTLAGRWWRAQLQFHADRPWWAGPAETLDYGLAAPTPFFPIFPLVLSSSNIQGQLTADMTAADAPSHPVWTVTGPGTALTLTNLTTGAVIQVNAVLGDGQTMTIDTRQGFQSVRRDDGTNLMGSLATDPTMWPLADGVVNQVSALLTGANSSSRIRGVYSPQYAGI
jgi:hypothetical protein